MCSGSPGIRRRVLRHRVQAARGGRTRLHRVQGGDGGGRLEPSAGFIRHPGLLRADAFVEGIKAAGVGCPTRKAFINNLRLVKGYDAGGAFIPVDSSRDLRPHLLLRVLRAGRRTAAVRAAVRRRADLRDAALSTTGRCKKLDPQVASKPRAELATAPVAAPWVRSSSRGWCSGASTRSRCSGLVLTYNVVARLQLRARARSRTSPRSLYYWLHEVRGLAGPGRGGRSVVFVVGPLVGLFLWPCSSAASPTRRPWCASCRRSASGSRIPAFTKILYHDLQAARSSTRGLGGDPPGGLRLLRRDDQLEPGHVIIGAAVVAIGLAVSCCASHRSASRPGRRSTRRASPHRRASTPPVIERGLVDARVRARRVRRRAAVSRSSGSARSSSRCCSWCRSPPPSSGACASLPLAFAGALLIGLLQGCRRSTRATGSRPASTFADSLKTGFKPSIPFIVMLVVLLALPGAAARAVRGRSAHVAVPAGGRDRRRSTADGLAGRDRPARRRARAVLGAAVAQRLLGRCASARASRSAVLFLTFTIVTGEGGMLSLVQVTLAGIGAFTAAKLATESGWPVGLALLAGAALARADRAARRRAQPAARRPLPRARDARVLAARRVPRVRPRRTSTTSAAASRSPARSSSASTSTTATNFYLLLAVVFCVVARRSS